MIILCCVASYDEFFHPLFHLSQLKFLYSSYIKPWNSNSKIICNNHVKDTPLQINKINPSVENPHSFYRLVSLYLLAIHILHSFFPDLICNLRKYIMKYFYQYIPHLQSIWALTYSFFFHLLDVFYFFLFVRF